MKTIHDIDGIRKWDFVNKETYYEVTFYELMGERWVTMGPEGWCLEDAEEFISEH